MEAGRKLDILVAEKVMGCTIKDGECDCRNKGGFQTAEHGNCELGGLHQYSTDMYSAWKVVNHTISTNHWHWAICWNGEDSQIDIDWYPECKWTELLKEYYEKTDTERAICLASLKAVNNSNEQR